MVVGENILLAAGKSSEGMFEACTPKDSRWNLSPLPELFEVFSLRSSALIYKPATFEVRLKESNLKGFWEVGGTLQVVGGSLLVTTYGSLTLAAQFKDVTPPENHHGDLLVSLPDGDYSCRIIQMLDPKQQESVGDDNPDFVVEVLQATEQGFGAGEYRTKCQA